MDAMYQARTSAAGLSDLVKLVSEQADRPIVVAEVGSFRGESARIMLDTGAVSRIYCIDPWVAGYDPSDIASNQDMVSVEADFDRRVGGDPRVVKCKGDIVDFASGYNDPSIDLVYIDAKHTYDSAVRDIGVALGRIKPRIAVSGHDYNRRAHADVCRAVDELLGGPQRVFADRSWVVFQGNSGVSDQGLGKGKAMSSVDYSKIWDRFDMVIVLAYTGYQDRIPPLRAELERVGLAGRAELFWSFPSPFDTRFANSIRLHGTIRKPSQFNEVMNHYRAMKTALELGKEHVLILEDDVRFVRDMGLLAAHVGGLPEDYDVAKFEWFCKGDPKNVKRGDAWAPLSGFDTTGGAAVAYSARGLKWKTEAMERPARYDDFHGMLYVNDVYDTSGNLSRHRAYVATPLLAIQEPKYYRTSNYGIYSGNPYGGFLHTGSYGAYGVNA